MCACTRLITYDEHAQEPTERASEADTVEKEWWEDASLPWNSKPTRQDYWCLGWFGFVGIFLSLIHI